MSEAWIAAFALLAILNLVIVLVLIGLMRQIGVLHQRVRPIGPGAHEEGPLPGTALEHPNLIPVGAADPFSERSMVLVGYIHPECSICRDLPSFMEAVYRTRPPELDLGVALVTDTDLEGAREYAAKANLSEGERLELYQNSEIMQRWKIPGSPYVLALERTEDPSVGARWRVLAGGVINELEQLEMLLDRAQIFRSAPEPPQFDPSAAPAAIDLAVRSANNGAATERASNDELGARA